ncbi:MAG: cation:dicarboxylase symporter family transporter [Verrucomicrobia bacterium]|nr:cation:dicarboxylase symporter family transporter [Verrucomicrobiota bacterium]
MRLFKMSLSFQMAVATLLGILCGLFFGDLCEIFSPYASAYIMLLKVTAVPYLIGAIMHGVGQLGIWQSKQILKKGVFFIALAWTLNILIIYMVTFLFPKPQSTQLGGYTSGEIPELNFADLLIPDNIFYDLANNIIPAIVIFSLLIGIALMHLKDKQVMMGGLRNLVDVLTRITGWIARITPFGTFLIIANQVGTVQLSTFKQVSTYILLYMIGTAILIFWIFPRLIHMLTQIPASRWLKELSPILLLAYTTNVVIVCLPYIIELLKKETHLLDPGDDKAQSQIEGTVSVVFNLPLGSLFITVFIFFVSLLYNLPLAFSSQVELFVTTFLTSLGAVGLGSWINSLNFILDSLGLPIESINLYLTTLPFTAGFQSMVSLIEISSLSLLITLACRGLLKIRAGHILRQSLLTIVPVLLLCIGIRFFNPFPEIKNEKRSIYELSISSTIPVKIYKTPPSPSAPLDDSFEQILSSKVLRVGYHIDTAPFCFLNVDNHVVGYDIAFAYELAYDLGCKLELVPLSYQDIGGELAQGKYDIAMSSVTINEQRLKTAVFSQPYLTPRMVLVVPEAMRKYYVDVEKIRANPKTRIAVLKGSAYEAIAKEYFPQKEILLLESYLDFDTSDPCCALLWEEQEAIAWTLCNRGYRVVFPKPTLGIDSLGYAIRPGNSRFLNYLNDWLQLKKTQGFTQKQQELWIYGKTEIAAPYEPRWSIVRDVLHWID